MNEKYFIRIVIAAIVGEIALILFTTLSQEVIVDGIRYGASTNADLFIGISTTLLAGIISGVIAALIGGRNNKWPHILISIFIASETSYLIAANKILNPTWFAIVSAMALILTIWLGFYIVNRLKN